MSECRNANVWKFQFKQYAEYYIEAAETFPDDEVHAAEYFEVALQACFWLGKPLKDVLPLISRIDEATTRMKPIWGNSVFSEKGEPPLRNAFLFRDAALAGIGSGAISLEDIVKPKQIVSSIFYNHQDIPGILLTLSLAPEKP